MVLSPHLLRIITLAPISIHPSIHPSIWPRFRIRTYLHVGSLFYWDPLRQTATIPRMLALIDARPPHDYYYSYPALYTNPPHTISFFSSTQHRAPLFLPYVPCFANHGLGLSRNEAKRSPIGNHGPGMGLLHPTHACPNQRSPTLPCTPTHQPTISLFLQHSIALLFLPCVPCFANHGPCAYLGAKPDREPFGDWPAILWGGSRAGIISSSELRRPVALRRYHVLQL